MLEDDLAALETIKMEIRNFRTENSTNIAADNALYNKLKTMESNRDALKEKIKWDEGLLAQYNKELEEAKKREAKYIKYYPHTGTDPNEAKRVRELAKQALERELEELEERQRDVILTAPCDGFVSSIDSQVGEVVILPDFPVLSITEEKPSSIIAYVNENLAGHFMANKEVEIVKGSKPKQIGRSEITYIGPRVEQLPQRLWRNPAVPQWGRLMQIEIPLRMKLIPGELVGIRVL